MIVDVAQVDPEETEPLSPDETIGMLYHPEHATNPEGHLYDLNRLQAAIAEYRREFGDDAANIGLWEDGNGTVFLALWSDHDCSRAVVVAPRVRNKERGPNA